MTFFLKTVNQHPVVAGERLDFLDANVVQRGQGLGGLQALQHAAQVAHFGHRGIELDLVGFEFQLQHQHIVFAVQQTLVADALQVQLQHGHLHLLGNACGLLHHGRCFRAGQHRQWLIQQRIGVQAKQSLDVGTDLLDTQLGQRQRDEQAVGLDGARKPDGFIGAIIQQGFKRLGVEWIHIKTS